MKQNETNRPHGRKSHDVKYPYFSPPQKVYNVFMEGMSIEEQRGVSNAVAHHMIPIEQTAEGWLFTRSDYAEKEMLCLIDKTGRWVYLRSPDAFKE